MAIITSEAPKMDASGAITGTRYLSSNCSVTMTTPGHNRRGLRRLSPSVSGMDCLVIVVDNLRLRRRASTACSVSCGSPASGAAPQVVPEAKGHLADSSSPPQRDTEDAEGILIAFRLRRSAKALAERLDDAAATLG